MQKAPHLPRPAPGPRHPRLYPQAGDKERKGIPTLPYTGCAAAWGDRSARVRPAGADGFRVRVRSGQVGVAASDPGLPMLSSTGRKQNVS